MTRRKRKKTKHTSFVTLSPIEYRHDDPEGRLETIADTLEAEAKNANCEPEKQILLSCPMVHMARLQIIDNVIPPMGQLPPDSLKSKYLLFVAEVDGEIDDFLDALYNGPQYPFDWKAERETRKEHEAFVQNVWGQCLGYPDDKGCVFFRQYMHRCRIKVRLPFAAYDYAVHEIDEAKAIQAGFTKFVEANQGLGPEELHAKWQEFVEEYSFFAGKGHLAIDKSALLGKHKPADREPLPPAYVLRPSGSEQAASDRRHV